jgi:hypothetical protein
VAARRLTFACDLHQCKREKSRSYAQPPTPALIFLGRKRWRRACYRSPSHTLAPVFSATVRARHHTARLTSGPRSSVWTPVLIRSPTRGLPNQAFAHLGRSTCPSRSATGVPTQEPRAPLARLPLPPQAVLKALERVGAPGAPLRWDDECTLFFSGCDASPWVDSSSRDPSDSDPAAVRLERFSRLVDLLGSPRVELKGTFQSEEGSGPPPFLPSLRVVIRRPYSFKATVRGAGLVLRHSIATARTRPAPRGRGAPRARQRLRGSPADCLRFTYRTRRGGRRVRRSQLVLRRRRRSGTVAVDCDLLATRRL